MKDYSSLLGTAKLRKILNENREPIDSSAINRKPFNTDAYLARQKVEDELSVLNNSFEISIEVAEREHITLCEMPMTCDFIEARKISNLIFDSYNELTHKTHYNVRKLLATTYETFVASLSDSQRDAYDLLRRIETVAERIDDYLYGEHS